MYNKDKLDAQKAERQNWENTKISKVLARNPERKTKFVTTSGIEVKRLYAPEDVAELDYNESLSYP
ncbi:MAG: methylmalonyl-CoA mutase, partial [Lutispora sp.]|nr:methylmalonyl-CoA mutase [Lutispora sp.]